MWDFVVLGGVFVCDYHAFILDHGALQINGKRNNERIGLRPKPVLFDQRFVLVGYLARLV